MSRCGAPESETAIRIVYPKGHTKNVKKQRPLYVKNPTAHRLAHQLSQQMGVTLTDAVIHALEEKVGGKSRQIDRKRIDAICAKVRALAVLDSRPPDEILGYDEFGLPR